MPLGCDESLCRLDEPSDSLDRPREDCERLVDEPVELTPEDLDSELLETIEPLLVDDRLPDDGDDAIDDCGDEPLLFASVDELVLLSPLLEERTDDFEPESRELELRDPDDLLSDDCDELARELLRPELRGELLEEISDEPLEGDRLLDDGPDDTGLLDSELRRPILELLFDELSAELEPLLWDDSLEELGDDRDDSLTLEDDLLDP